jgi:hypothetical protein
MLEQAASPNCIFCVARAAAEFSTCVALRVVFVNVLARWRLMANKVDIEEASLSGILNSTVECKCWRCVEARGLPFGCSYDLRAKCEASCM